MAKQVTPVGFIRTARGKSLNLASLIAKSKTPINKGDVDLKNKIPTMKKPPNPPNVRGFQPSTEGVAAPPTVASQQVDNPHVEQSPITLADITGVTIDKPRHFKTKPEDPVDASNKILSDIQRELNSNLHKKQPGKR